MQLFPLEICQGMLDPGTDGWEAATRFGNTGASTQFPSVGTSPSREDQCGCGRGREMGACSPAWVTGMRGSRVCLFSPILGVLAQLVELLSSALRDSRMSIPSPGALADF